MFTDGLSGSAGYTEYTVDDAAIKKRRKNELAERSISS